MRAYLRPLAGVLIFLLVWEATSRTGVVDVRFVPPPSTVLITLCHILGERIFLRDAVSTILTWVIAVPLATLLGFVFGLLLGGLPRLRTASTIIVGFLRAVPGVALIPLVISLIGADTQAKITLATLAAVWPVLFSTLHALGEVDPRRIEVATLYRVPRWRQLIWVTIPSTLPFVLAGVRLAASIALISLISTEFLSRDAPGLGQFIYVQGSGAGRMDLVLAGTVCTGLLGLTANLLIDAARRQLLPWAPEGGAV